LGVIRQDLPALEATAKLTRLLASDSQVALTLANLTTSPNYEPLVTTLADALYAVGKPALFVVTPGSVANKARQIIQDRKILYCDSIDDAIRLVHAYLGYEPHSARLAQQSKRNFTPLC